MKKVFTALLICFFVQNCSFASYLDKQLNSTKKTQEYNTVKTHTQTYSAPKNVQKNIKDPKLIKSSNYVPVSDSDYQRKIEEDEIVYTEKMYPILAGKDGVAFDVQTSGNDLYKLYRITEKIIRANNLGYTNWRVVLNKETEDFNAYTTASNLIAVNSALYDSYKGNDDAIAFVICHELSHQILGHAQQESKMRKKYLTIMRLSGLNYLPMEYYKHMRELELEADFQALELLTRAGFSQEKALEAVSFMQTLPEGTYSLYSSHPKAEKRRENLIQAIEYSAPDWKEEGKANIYRSEVAPVSRSADRVSFVISGNERSRVYQPETYAQRARRFGYASYLRGNYNDAVKYLKKAVKEQPDYASYLYLSYAYEKLYDYEHKDKYAQAALENAQSAKNLERKGNYAQEQLELLRKRGFSMQ